MKKYLLTGLAILLPLVVTIAILGWLINLLTNPFVGIVSDFLFKFNLMPNGFLFLTREETIRYGSQLLILIFLFFFTLGLGVVGRLFFVRTLLNLGDKILHRIPLVNTVYKTSKDIVNQLFSPEAASFKQVVMVAFPHPGVYVLGLVAREAPRICSEKVGADLISVLIPTTPNPINGFLLFYKKEEIIYLDMKSDDAIKFIISCGMIMPKETL